MEEEYERLLNRARAQLPQQVFKGERFEMPRPVSTIAGNRTVLHNFKEICDRLRRDQNHFLKFLSGELATAGTIEGTRAFFQGRFRADVFERLVSRYVKDFVICPVCNQPDTRLVREDRFNFLICEACGARSSARGV